MDSLKELAELTWKKIWVDVFAENDFLIKTVGTTLWGLLCFILVNSLLLVPDLIVSQNWLHKYKIQEKKNNKVSKSLLIFCS